MKKPVIHTARRTEKIRTVHQSLSAPIAWSSIGHLVFILLFIFVPKFTPEASVSSHIINVQLVASKAPVQVSTPVVDQKETPQEVVPETAPAPKAEISTATKPKEAVSLAPEVIEKKRSMKKKTYKRERLLESAIKSVEKRVEASKADPKKQALEKIRSELRGREATEDSATVPGIAGINSGGTPTADIQRIYNAEVQYSIQRNWAFSDQMAGGARNLYNLVAVTILRSGRIEDIQFERKSGNSYFDDSTFKAIQKSNPLPPIPEEIRGASIILRFRFIPEGLK
jgi:colicin import membrane protein